MLKNQFTTAMMEKRDQFQQAITANYTNETPAIDITSVTQLNKSEADTVSWGSLQGYQSTETQSQSFASRPTESTTAPIAFTQEPSPITESRTDTFSALRATIPPENLARRKRSLSLSSGLTIFPQRRKNPNIDALYLTDSQGQSTHI